MSIRFEVTPSIPQGGSAWYSAKLTDRTGAAIVPANLTTLTLTYYAPNYVAVSPATNIINNRSVQNVLNANNVTLDNQGNLLWAIQPADTVMMENGAYEYHVATFRWTGTDVGAGAHEVLMRIERIV